MELQTSFTEEGYLVLENLLSQGEINLLLRLTKSLITRHRNGDLSAIKDAISIATVTTQHPLRNPAISAELWAQEPFIIGNLLAAEPEFRLLLANINVWSRVAALLDAPFDEVVFHMSNLTRKPANIGPAIGWHRDATNTYFSTEDERTIRLLFPLQLMSRTNGGTAVLPYSHKVLHLKPDQTNVMFPVVTPGSALAIHSRVLHGGAENRSDQHRDVIVLQFGLRSSSLRYSAEEAFSLCGFNEVTSH